MMDSSHNLIGILAERRGTLTTKPSVTAGAIVDAPPVLIAVGNCDRSCMVLTTLTQAPIEGLHWLLLAL
jgi:hypothetical protein